LLTKDNVNYYKRSKYVKGGRCCKDCYGGLIRFSNSKVVFVDTLKRLGLPDEAIKEKLLL
jgi:hypothetical protein